jgi:hypothetical protein
MRILRVYTSVRIRSRALARFTGHFRRSETALPASVCVVRQSTPLCSDTRTQPGSHVTCRSLYEFADAGLDNLDPLGLPKKPTLNRRRPSKNGIIVLAAF